MDDFSLNRVQKASFSLIQNDLRFLYTAIRRINTNKSNYIISLLPYLGIVIDGAEEWVKAINNTCKHKLEIPLFSSVEKKFYEQIRNCVKLWGNDYNKIYEMMNDLYCESENYFKSACKPIARYLHLYDIYGVDTVNGVLCGNTILYKYYSPLFNYVLDNGNYMYEMSVIGGKYIALFGAKEEYETDDSLKFDMHDYGGFVKSPVGSKFSDRFVLLSILCQINFLIYCIERWIKEDIPAKLRFAYLQYYSLLNVIPQINNRLKTNFVLSDKWNNDKFRNAMAHYKLGIVLKENDLIQGDIMFGLTDYILNEKYSAVKDSIYSELEKLAIQIGDYLKLNKELVTTN